MEFENFMNVIIRKLVDAIYRRDDVALCIA